MVDIVVTLCRNFYVTGVVTSGAGLVSVPAGSKTGRFLCGVVYVIMALGGNFHIGGVVTSGAGLVSVPTGSETSSFLRRMIYVIMAERFGASGKNLTAGGAGAGLGTAGKTGGSVAAPFAGMRGGRKARLNGFIFLDIGIAAPAVERIMVSIVRGFGLRGGRGGVRSVVHGFGFQHRAVFRLKGDGIAVNGCRAHADAGGGGDIGYGIGNGVAALAARHRAVGSGHRRVLAVGVARAERHGKAHAAAVVHGRGGRCVGVARAVLAEGYVVAVDGCIAYGDAAGGGDARYRIGDLAAALGICHRTGGGGNGGHAAVGVACGKRDLERGAAVIGNACCGLLRYGVARTGRKRHVGVPARVQRIRFRGIRVFIPGMGGGSVGFIILCTAGGSGGIVITGKGVAAAGGRGGKRGHRGVKGSRDAVRTAGTAVFVKRKRIFVRLPNGVQRKVGVAGIGGSLHVRCARCGTAGAPALKGISIAGGGGGGEGIGLVYKLIHCRGRVLTAVGIKGDFIYFFNTEGHVTGAGIISLNAKQIGGARRELLAHKEVAVAARKA